MLRIGMTGGIASGKSTAVAMFRDAGCMVLEADPLVHQLLKPGQAAADQEQATGIFRRHRTTTDQVTGEIEDFGHGHSQGALDRQRPA